jgi:hypothetical protein
VIGKCVSQKSSHINSHELQSNLKGKKCNSKLNGNLAKLDDSRGINPTVMVLQQKNNNNSVEIEAYLKPSWVLDSTKNVMLYLKYINWLVI